MLIASSCNRRQLFVLGEDFSLKLREIWVARTVLLLFCLLSLACSASGSYTIAPEVLERVSAERGLSFKEVVVSERVPPRVATQKFKASIREHNSKGELAHVEIIFERLGLFPTDYRYARSLAKQSASTAAAFYSPSTKIVTLVSRSARPSEEQYNALLHELVHVLQDQHFDLSSILDSTLSMDALQARRAVIEGDAVLTAQRIIGFDSCDRVVERIERSLVLRKRRAIIHEVPVRLALYEGLSYPLGRLLMCERFERSGYRGINTLLQSPPMGLSELFGSSSDRPVSCDEPRSDRLGPGFALALLAPSEGFREAFQTIRYWDSDCVVFDEATSKLRWQVRFQSRAPAEKFTIKLQALYRDSESEFSRDVQFEPETNTVRVLVR